MKICIERIKTGYLITDADGERHSAETIKRAFMKLRELFGLSTDFQTVRREQDDKVREPLKEGLPQNEIVKRVDCIDSLVSMILKELGTQPAEMETPATPEEPVATNESMDGGETDPDRMFKPFTKGAFSTRPKDHDA